MPRSAHDAIAGESGRPDAVSVLEEQARTRIAELSPIRYGRMLASPFAFFRGAAAVMAHDLAHGPTTGIRVQLCGDAHLSNFGLFGTAERRLVFDINDFDETLPGPFEWDLKRLAASLEIAGRERGFGRPRRAAIVGAAAAEYRSAIRRFAGLGHLEVFYAGLDADAVLERLRPTLPPKVARRAERTAARARSRDSAQALERLTAEVDGAPRIAADPPLVVPLRDLIERDREQEMGDWFVARLREYRRTLAPDRRMLLSRYRFADAARKVVGVGSVGTRAWIVLLIGRDTGDPLFLQVKEAPPSVLEPFAGPGPHRSQGQRVVAGQRLMQAAGDAFLGWVRVESPDDSVRRDFYVRQLRDWKGSADPSRMTPEAMRIYGRLCAWSLARAHARSGDPREIAGYIGRRPVLDRAICEFAVRYADRNARDHAALGEAVASGRVEADTSG